jgi:putative transposase
MKNSNIYAGYRYPAEIISHTVWLYHHFTFSFRDIEELLAARNIVVSYETIRQWCKKIWLNLLELNKKESWSAW